jgi:hypothetical protein
MLVLILLASTNAAKVVPLSKVPDIRVTERSRPGNSQSLQEIFHQGERALAENRPFEAESWFKVILVADSNDWDARERLVGIYQALGLKEERDRQLGALRSMYHSGLGWKPYICRDQFLHGNRLVRSLEVPGLESSARRVLVFMVNDFSSGRFLYATTVKRNEKTESGASHPKRMDVLSYELVVVSNSHRKAVEVLNRRPGYSDMKRIFLKTLGKK